MNRVKNACARRVSKIECEISVRLHFSLFAFFVQSSFASRAVVALECECVQACDRPPRSLCSLLSAFHIWSRPAAATVAAPLPMRRSRSAHRPLTRRSPTCVPALSSSPPFASHATNHERCGCGCGRAGHARRPTRRCVATAAHAAIDRRIRIRFARCCRRRRILLDARQCRRQRGHPRAAGRTCIRHAVAHGRALHVPEGCQGRRAQQAFLRQSGRGARADLSWR